MKSSPKINGKTWQKGGTLLAVGLLAGQRLMASTVLMDSSPQATTSLSAQEDAANSVMNVFLPPAWNSDGSAELLQYGPVILHPHVSYSLTYGNGLNSDPNQKTDTVFQGLSIGLGVNLGQHWALDYTIGLNFYSAPQFRDNVSHSASVAWNASRDDWIFGASQSLNYSDSPQVETAAQTRQENFMTGLSAGYAFNSTMSADFGLNQNINLVSGLQNSYNWSTMEWFNYEFWPRLNGGIGAGAGYTKVTDASGAGASNPDFIDEQLQARLNWRITDKISLGVSGGFEDQQFTSPGYNDQLNPTFGASAQYQPFDYTQISLSAARTVGASDYYVVAQSTENTSVGLSVNQRLLQKYQLTLGLAYTQTDYTSTLAGGGFSASTKRSDNGVGFSTSLGRSFFKHGNWSVNYQYNDNHSTVSGYSQQSHQVGLQVGFTY